MHAAPPQVQSIRTMRPMNCHPTYCGMVVMVEHGRIGKIAGVPENPDSRGFLYLRGRAAHQIIGNPLRIERPLRRAGPRGCDRWQPVSWDKALDEIAAAIRRAGRERVGVSRDWPASSPGRRGSSRRAQPSTASWATPRASPGR